jgi:murein DD-endopeptidase MepM/ murein hydrolase activator NlpD
VVVHKGRKGGYGKMVTLRHMAGYRTYYGHLSRYARIRVGRKVSQGQTIGYVGQTGLATGPHLDFRVQRWKKFINPLRLKIPQGPPLPARSMPGFKAAVARLRTGMMEAALGTRELDAHSVAALLAPASES